MRISTLLEGLPDTLLGADRLLIERAYKYAKKLHASQSRASGEPYIKHSLAVAQILVDIKLPPAAIAAGLLHDVVEDTTATVGDLRRAFDKEVASLVDGVTKLTKQVARVQPEPTPSWEGQGHAPSRMAAERAETIRKTFLAMGDDVRVVLIKLADRLHNMRTLSHLPSSKRMRIAQETLDIFAPLANRLGFWQMKWELEDLAFRHVQPNKYRDIATAINRRRDERETVISETVARLQDTLQENGIIADVSGRPKHIYSIFKKMERKNLPFENIYDVRAVRVLVKPRESEPTDDPKEKYLRERKCISDCYMVLGLVHQLWKPIPGEFDDYIATPKDNFYQSLHTSMLHEDGNNIEVQIRTEDMHHNSEYGIAAHWRYKEGGNTLDTSFDARVEWLRSMMSWHQDVTDGQEFVDALKSDMFPDRVFTFTPRGDIIDLPGGATPIDFAYHIHTAVGERCRGAKVNGKLVPLNRQLQSGDQIEILAAKRGGPSRDWLNADLGYARSARARENVRNWFRHQDQEKNIAAGRRIVDRELKRLNIEGVVLDTIADMFSQPRVDEFLAAVGCGDIQGQTVVNRIVVRLYADGRERDDTLPPPDGNMSPAVRSGEAIIQGAGRLTLRLARCCNPVPGDEIAGYTTKARAATIHRSDCPNILRVREQERMIAVSWGREVMQSYPVTIRIVAYDREGLMRDISTIVADEHINIGALDLPPDQEHVITMNVTLEVSHLMQLRKVLTRIEQLPNVTQANRYKSG